MKPDFLSRIDENRIQCSLCPHRCRIDVGKAGFCKVRKNTQGNPEIPYYGCLSAVSMDPIEKKPLYHYHPGKKILSIGFFGCNLRCLFCQNHEISQNIPKNNQYTSPEEIIEIALREKSFGIAYTYSEPLVHFEYIRETARLAKQKGLKNIIVTNGYLSQGPAEELFACMDAANIDLKAFTEDFYKKETGGHIAPVLQFIRSAYEKIHIEITTLVIPGKNDSKEEINNISKFIAGLSTRIPYHLSCYYPRYQYSIPATRQQDLMPLVEMAKENLSFVYAGNTDAMNTTICPVCGTILAERSGYKVRCFTAADGKCVNCGEKVFSAE